jgi:hypothetical protein
VIAEPWLPLEIRELFIEGIARAEASAPPGAATPAE